MKDSMGFISLLCFVKRSLSFGSEMLKALIITKTSFTQFCFFDSIKIRPREGSSGIFASCLPKGKILLSLSTAPNSFNN